jgi:hypothetical protein
METKPAVIYSDKMSECSKYINLPSLELGKIPNSKEN